MSFGQAISAFWGKYATFSGRARRSEFWFAQLFLTLVSLAIAIVFPGEGDNNSFGGCGNLNKARISGGAAMNITMSSSR